MKKWMWIVVSLMMVAGTALADEVTMATDDNLDDFVKRAEAARGRQQVAGDQTTAEQMKKAARGERARRAKDRRSSFGAIVSTEAKRYKEEGLDKSKQFGEWVSNQRSQRDQQAGGVAEGGAQISSTVRDAGVGVTPGAKGKKK